MNLESSPVKLVQKHFLFIVFDIRRQKRRCGHRLRLTLHLYFLLSPQVFVFLYLILSNNLIVSEIFESLFLLLTIFNPFQN